MLLQKISIYPVKSLGAVNIEDSIVTPRGLKYDRRYMLVDKDLTCITQRDYSQLAGLTAIAGEGSLSVQAGERTSIEWHHRKGSEIKSETVKVRVWDSIVDAVTAGDDVNQWFSDLLGVQVSLVYMSDIAKRGINPDFDRGNEIVSFADGYPLLLVATGSLSELNSNLEKPVEMERFRPNVVVDTGGSFDEDNWKRIEIGDARFRVTKPCARCVVTTIDQSSGNRQGAEPLKTLAKLRKAKEVYPARFENFGLSENDALFGINLVPETPYSTISVDDVVNVLETWD